MPSRRQSILEALAARLQAIEINSGFQTNAGRLVFLGEAPALGPDDADEAVAIVPFDTVAEPNRMELLPVEIQGVAKASLEAPHIAAEAVLADVATAIELADRTLGGLVKTMDVNITRTLPREDGSTTVGFGVTYFLRYVREWGKP